VGVCFPFLFFALLWGASYLREKDWRVALLVAATLWGTTVTLITEILSLFRAVAAGPLLLAWAAACAGAGVWIFREWQRTGHSPPRLAETVAPSRTTSRLPVAILAGLLVVFLALLGGIGLTAAPNTFDAMTYHLPRVLHWLQNGHVGHYPTAILRQLFQGPWSSYAILQFLAPLESDHLANGIQWFALGAGAIGCSLLARRGGADGLGQLATAVLAATAPMAVLQGTSPQTDLVVACWLVSAVWFMAASLEADVAPGRNHFFLALAGLALGHAILTKATAYLFGFPFCCWLLLELLRRKRHRALAPLALFACLVLLPNLPTYARQLRTFGSPLGPAQEAADLSLPAVPYGNDIHTPGAILSNVLRNLALELTTPWPAVTDGIEQSVVFLHRSFGWDVNDPRTTWPDMAFKLEPGGWCNENFAGNPLHALLTLIALALVAVRVPRSPLGAYALAVAGGFVFVSASLRWNIWMSRLLLPSLILAAPLVGIVIARYWPRWLAFGVPMLAICTAVPVALHNTTRPLIGPEAYWRFNRLEQYYSFSGGEAIGKVHQDIVDTAAKFPCRSIGLRLGRDEAEYPLWLTFRARGLKPRLEHENVTNPSGRYYSAIPAFDPDVTVLLQVSEGRYQIQPHRPPQK
jgi:hypothetical protein